MPEHFDVIVIGGGTGGLVTASLSARLGRKSALIEREALGGDCLWTGCVPTKALIATAKLAHQMRNAQEYGLTPVDVQLAPRAVMESMREQRRRVAPHDDPDKFRKLGIDVIKGSAKLVARNEVEVNGRRLVAKDVVLATGARTAVPPVEGLQEHGFLDHRTFLEQDAFSRRLLILGGGYIGIEFAQMFRRFGCEVTVVEMADEIIGKEDADVIARIRKILVDEGIVLRTGFGVKRVAAGKVVTIEDQAGRREEIAVDEIFVASGRRANTEDLGLEMLGVKMNRSFIAVDKYLQTSVPRIWAVGDVHGGLQFTHVAAYEATKVVRNMLFPGKSAASYEHVPWCLYTDPEVGHIGMTEAEAKAAHGDNVRIYKVELDDVDRAIVDRATRGFVKFVCDPKGRILGAHVVSATASTLIEEIVLARKKGVKVSALAQLISPYPSLADAVQNAATKFYENVGESWVGRVGKRLAAWSQ